MAARRPTLNLSALLLDDRLAAGEALPAVRTARIEWSLGDLARVVGSVAAGLSEAGLRQGDTLCVAWGDRPEWLAAVLGGARVGAICALVSPTTPPDRLRDALARAAPRMVVSDDPQAAEGAEWLSPARLVAAVTARLPDPGPARTRPDDLCYMLLTAGSTRRPTWAVRRNGDIRACLSTYGARVLRLQPGDVTWTVSPLASSCGFGNSCYLPLGAGACAWLGTGDQSLEALVGAVRAGGVNVVFGVPTWWTRVARHASEGRIAPDALAGMRLAVAAGEHLPARVRDEVNDVLGLALVDGLGSSEASSLPLSDY